MEDLFDTPSERYFPTRRELDLACPCPGRPVLVLRHDGHIVCVNSAGLAKIGLDKSTVAAVSKSRGIGEIRVDQDGEPTGVFTEGATSIPLDHVPVPIGEHLEAGAVAFSKELASLGITTCGGILQIGDEGIAGKAGAVEIPLMEQFIRKGIIEQDFVFYIVTSKPKQLLRVDKTFKRLSSVDEDRFCDRFSVGGIKIYADGSFGARTAAMYEPFSDSADGAPGFLVKDRATLAGLFHETHDLGYQVAIHAIGDKANRVVVDVFAGLLNGHPGHHRHRIEHASIVDAGTLRDAAKLGIIFACQPAFIRSEQSWLEARLGPERLKRTYAFRSCIDAGIVLAGASDAPVESANVLTAMQACVTRHGIVPGESIPVVDALRMFTAGAAFALRQELVKGSIVAGKLADLVFLNGDLRAVPPDSIGDLRILRTYHRGALIFRRSS
jgi:hypothetical protein